MTSRRMASRAFGVIVPASPNRDIIAGSLVKENVINTNRKESQFGDCVLVYYVWDVMISGKERWDAQVAKGNKKIHLY